jgi:hypothetical protein
MNRHVLHDSSNACLKSRQIMRNILYLVLVIIVVCLFIYKCIGNNIYNVECNNRLREIGLALHSYYLQHGSFPPAYTIDKNGKALNSWRTLIVPGRLWYTFPANYDFAESWNNDKNYGLLLNECKKAQNHFQCPATDNKNTAITNYVAVVGFDTMWPGNNSAKILEDGSDKDKILVIEIINSDILWMEPRDLTLEQVLDSLQAKQGIAIGSQHNDGIHYVTVAGEVHTLDRNIDRESLKKLFIRNNQQ